MLPHLPAENTLQPQYKKYLKAVVKNGFVGEIRHSYADRIVWSTDNSIYQVPPQAVVFPKTARDIQVLCRTANETDFSDIKLTARGGGTGTNGQALNSGVIVDCSKFMNNILEVNPTERWVRVQPGVVLDQLNSFLKTYDLFFAPNLSPSSRATLGGMINTDACGKGSRVYGRTSQHVLELGLTLSDGTLWHSRPLFPNELDEIVAREDIIGRVYRTAKGLLEKHRDQIAADFPKMKRFLTGYNLAHLEKNQHFDLNALVCGSEGSLAFVTEAKLNLCPIPKHKKLVAVKYASFDDALADAMRLLETEPTAIETIDETILSLAKQDEIYHRIKNFIADEGNQEVRTINLVEYSHAGKDEVDQKSRILCETIETNKGKPGAALGYYLTEISQEISALWDLRKKGVGLLGNAKGPNKPSAFVEDTAVPPQHLADYIRDFKALLDQHKVTYAMYGHVDVGCLHVRPAINMMDPEEEKRVRAITDGAAALCLKYGGVLWAEHGKGFRSEYTRQFFGDTLFQALREIKAAFDPNNRLNPGKVVTPAESNDPIVRIEGPSRGAQERTIHPNLQQQFEAAISCNGNGACFSWDPHHVMCPSSKVTADRVHSPKGRAAVMREWLRLLSQNKETQTFTRESEIAKRKGGIGGYLQRRMNNRKGRDNDFSVEVYEAMSGCLSCKACATQCPIHVDIPEFKSRFLEYYHSRYPRKIRDYLVAGMESNCIKHMNRPKTANAAMSFPFVKSTLAKATGLVDPPLFSEPSLQAHFERRHAQIYNGGPLPQGYNEKNTVILIQDVFTSAFDAGIVADLYDTLCILGYRPLIAPLIENGKPLHIKGFLKKFKDVAQKNIAFHRKLAKSGIPMIGIEPSMVLTYRQEYKKFFNLEDLGFHIQLPQEWLVGHLNKLCDYADRTAQRTRKYILLRHCMEQTSVPDAAADWRRIFEATGLKLSVPVIGCCGMAGTYGHEIEHQEESRGIFQMSWAEYTGIDEEAELRILATGYSCRTQSKRFAGFRPKHPLSIVAGVLRKEAVQRTNPRMPI